MQTKCLLRNQLRPEKRCPSQQAQWIENCEIIFCKTTLRLLGSLCGINEACPQTSAPKPISFKEAMKYIMGHEEYYSNGYEFYDFCGENVNVQFGK